MRARTALGVLIIIGVAACGGSAGDSTTTTAPTAETTTTGPTTTTTIPGFTVTSDDGAVTMEVPFEAMAEDPGIEITVLAPEDYPPELAGAAQNPNTRIYRLLPDDVTFDEPARLTRTIDVTNFGEFADGEHEIPIAVLLVRDSDGVYEPLGDLHIMRRGDQVEVSGDITHFSTLVTVSEQQSMTLVPDDMHMGFATEAGVDLFVGALFHGLGGSELQAPADLEGWGRSRSDRVAFFANGTVRMVCDEPGDEPVTTRLGFRVNFNPGFPDDEVGLRTTPVLAPGIGPQSILVKSVVPIACLAYDTSLIGRQASVDLQVDHPGQMTYIPNADFRGGLSGLQGTIRWTVSEPERPNFDWIGLVTDVNRNGMLDIGDTVYQPFPVDYTGDLGSFTLPLFGYADYFVYGLDGDAFGSVLGTGSSGMPLLDGIAAYYESFMGHGRFETSFGIFGSDGMPGVLTVGPGEDAVTEEWEVGMMWTPKF